MAFLQDLFRTKAGAEGREEPVGGPAPAAVREGRSTPEISMVTGKLVLLLDDVLSRVPTRSLKPGLHDPSRELHFEMEELLEGISRGRASIPLSRLAARYPETFKAPEPGAEDAAIALPLQKLIQQIGQASRRPSEPPAAAEPEPKVNAVPEPAPTIAPKLSEAAEATSAKADTAKVVARESEAREPVKPPPATAPKPLRKLQVLTPPPTEGAGGMMPSAPVEARRPVEPSVGEVIPLPQAKPQAAPVESPAAIAAESAVPPEQKRRPSVRVKEEPKPSAPAQPALRETKPKVPKMRFRIGPPQGEGATVTAATPVADAPVAARVQSPQSLPGAEVQKEKPPETTVEVAAPEARAEMAATEEAPARTGAAPPPSPAFSEAIVEPSAERGSDAETAPVEAVVAPEVGATPESESTPMAGAAEPVPPIPEVVPPPAEQQPAPEAKLPAPPPIFAAKSQAIASQEPKPLPAPEPVSASASPATPLASSKAETAPPTPLTPPIAPASEEPLPEPATAPPEPSVRMPFGRPMVRPPSLHGPAGFVTPQVAATTATPGAGIVFAPGPASVPAESKPAAPPVIEVPVPPLFPARMVEADQQEIASAPASSEELPIPPATLPEPASPTPAVVQAPPAAVTEHRPPMASEDEPVEGTAEAPGGDPSPSEEPKSASAETRQLSQAPRDGSGRAQELLGIHFSLARINQEPLQAIFMTDEFLDLPRMSQLSCGFPGVTGCMIVAGDALTQSGERPAGLDGAALCRLTTRLSATASEFSELPAVQTYTLHAGNRALSIFARQHVSVCVVHHHRGFLPGVRERLSAVADTLSKGVLGEAEAE